MMPIGRQRDEAVEGVELRHLVVVDRDEGDAEHHLHHDRELGDHGGGHRWRDRNRSSQWAASAHAPTAALVPTTTHAKSAWSWRRVTGAEPFVPLRRDASPSARMAA